VQLASLTFDNPVQYSLLFVMKKEWRWRTFVLFANFIDFSE